MANSLVQTRIDPDVKERASEILDHMGLTVSDVVRVLLTRIAKEGTLPFSVPITPSPHDARLKTKVQNSLGNIHPAILNDHEDKHFFVERRVRTLRKAKEAPVNATAANLWPDLITKFEGFDDIQPFEQFRSEFSPVSEDPFA